MSRSGSCWPSRTRGRRGRSSTLHLQSGFRPIGRKKTLVEGLCWPGRLGPGVRHRPLGVAQAPPAERGGRAVSPNGRSSFCGSSSSRSSPELEKTKKRGPASGTRWRFRLFGGVCENENGAAYSETADRGLDTLPAVEFQSTPPCRGRRSSRECSK